MRLKKSVIVFCSFFFLSCFCSAKEQKPLLLENLNIQKIYNDDLVQSIGSLICHVNEWEETLSCQEEFNFSDLRPSENQINFTDQEISQLWSKVTHYLSNVHPLYDHNESQSLYWQAYDDYSIAQTLVNNHQFDEAAKHLKRTHALLFSLWESAKTPIKDPLLFASIDSVLRKHKSIDLEVNKTIPSSAKRKMAPYVITDAHPMKSRLDAIFNSARVSLNPQTFDAAGFDVKCRRPRSFIRVASHPTLPGYLVKVSLDSEVRQKHGKPSWEWLVQRCQGAEKIQRIIEARKLVHFTVAQKWIYPLPERPSPPASPAYRRHLAILLVTDMHLVTESENLHAWRHNITKDHLHELYTILSYARGSSYRPDNITYTVNGQFAFIDTEYPTEGPDYKSIRRYLSPTMRVYWDKLIKNGGK